MQDTLRYKVVFDAIDSGYRTWWFPALGALVFIAVFGIALLVHQQDGAARGPARYIMIFSVLFGLVWVGLTGVSTYRDYARLRYSLESGVYDIVEGRALEFVPGDDHRPESFIVNGRRYSYSWSVPTAAYNRSQPHGGLIREGVRLRIADVDGQIARLEISQ